MGTRVCEWIDSDTGRVLAPRVEMAETAWSRMRGLLGRDGLGDGCGMWIGPCRMVHTWFMRFAIDLAYVDEGGTVVMVVPRMPPWRMSSAWAAHAVVELPAGTIAARCIAVGMRTLRRNAAE